MSVLLTIFLFIFFFVCLLLCLVIMAQESKSMGLGASFGGDAGESLFGTGTADVLKKLTGYLAGIFLIACVLLSLWASASEHAKRARSTVAIESIES